MQVRLRGKTLGVAQKLLDARIAASTNTIKNDLGMLDETDEHYLLAHAVRDARLSERRASRGLQEDDRIALLQCLHVGFKDLFDHGIILPSVAMFRDKFWVTFALTVPVVFWSIDLQRWLGYTAPSFPGSKFIPAILGTAVFVYGGLVDLPWKSLLVEDPAESTTIIWCWHIVRGQILGSASMESQDFVAHSGLAGNFQMGALARLDLASALRSRRCEKATPGSVPFFTCCGDKWGDTLWPGREIDQEFIADVSQVPAGRLWNTVSIFLLINLAIIRVLTDADTSWILAGGLCQVRTKWLHDVNTSNICARTITAQGLLDRSGR